MPGLKTTATAAKKPQGQQQQDGRDDSMQRPLVQEVPAAGAKRVQQLIARNINLPLADRAAAAEQQKLKGNEAFK